MTTNQFRGRIFETKHGYAPRTLLELDFRAVVGEILNKREWWTKCRRDDGAVCKAWLDEVERQWIAAVVARETATWEPYALDDMLPMVYVRYPLRGSAAEKRAFIKKACSTMPYNLIWHAEAWVWDDKMRVGDPSVREQLRSFHARITEQDVAAATAFLLAARRGDLTKRRFRHYVPNGDHRQRIVDALWVHVHRILQELEDIRNCITKTLERVIQENQLDAATVTAFVSPGPVLETWMSDGLICDDLKHKFVREVAVPENVPDDQKDWHPDSNNQVLDVIHASLYCCVLGETKCVAPDVTLLALTAVDHMQQMMFSGSELVENSFRGDAQYQWIPSNYVVSESCEVEIQSYINNLHPIKHRDVYDSIARIFETFVPIFDRVLSCLLNHNGPEPVMTCDSYGREIDEIPEHPPVPKILNLEPNGPSFTLRVRTVQVSTKIAEIHLTPENPSYAGGAWHVEGSDAEQIVATGIYYFGCDNITESKLSFRVIVQEPSSQQSDDLGMWAIYGLVNEQRLMQPLGSVIAEEDRCVVFPNTLQHRIEPFELADNTRPGVRKILAFFIVDPSKRIPSTVEIPPQQTEWTQQEVDHLIREIEHTWSVPDGVLDSSFVGTEGMILWTKPSSIAWDSWPSKRLWMTRRNFPRSSICPGEQNVKGVCFSPCVSTEIDDTA